MSDCLEDGGFWLPAKFFDDSDDSELCFPTDFPYGVDIGNGNSNSPQTRRSVKPTSPQSPLVGRDGIWRAGSSNGSRNGVVSPPLRDGNHAVGEVFNRAAGQVAKLKLDGGVGPGPTVVNNLKGPPFEPTRPVQLYLNASSSPILNTGNGKDTKKGSGVWSADPQRAVAGAGYGPRPVYPNLNPTHVLVPESRAVPAVRVGVAPAPAPIMKRTGTGFFLPRGYENINHVKKDSKVNSVEPRKNTPTATETDNSNGYHNNSSIPGWNLNKNNLNGTGCYHGIPPHPNPRISPGYEMLVARREAQMKEHGDYYIPNRRGL